MRDEVTERYFNSQVEVFSHGINPLENNISNEELARLCGAIDGSKIYIKANEDEITLTIRNEICEEMIRKIVVTEEGAALIINESFFLKKDYQNQGIGVRSFAIEAKEAKVQGFSKIITEAVVSKEFFMNGYYTWIRLGFDAEVQPDSLPPPFSQYRTLLELTSTDEGRSYWYNYGQTVTVEFDLREGSASWRILNAYLDEQGVIL